MVYYHCWSFDKGLPPTFGEQKSISQDLSIFSSQVSISSAWILNFDHCNQYGQRQQSWIKWHCFAWHWNNVAAAFAGLKLDFFISLWRLWSMTSVKVIYSLSEGKTPFGWNWSQSDSSAAAGNLLKLNFISEYILFLGVWALKYTRCTVWKICIVFSKEGILCIFRS